MQPLMSNVEVKDIEEVLSYLEHALTPMVHFNGDLESMRQEAEQRRTSSIKNAIEKLRTSVSGLRVRQDDKNQ